MCHLIHIGPVLELPVGHQLEDFPHTGDLGQQRGVGSEVQGYSSQQGKITTKQKLKCYRYEMIYFDKILNNST